MREVGRNSRGATDADDVACVLAQGGLHALARAEAASYHEDQVGVAVADFGGELEEEGFAGFRGGFCG